VLQVQGLDHIVLNVAEVRRSVAFYRDVLGLVIERLDEWQAGTIGFPSVRVSANTIIDLVEIGAEAARERGTPNLNHFCLVVADETLEPIAAHLAGHGVTVYTGPARRWGARGNGVSIYFRDPDDNEIEVRTYAPVALERLRTATARG
jgi:catechol 2,3-dioxygenase-like lactoylglutathione lyase family enzyme